MPSAKRPPDPRRLDVEALARDAGRLAGRWPLASFPRLVESTHPEAPRDGHEVEWAAEGDLRKPNSVAPEVWLALRAEASLTLVCQRCLGPLPTGVEVDRRIRFARDEETAAALDAELEEDVLALDRALDLHALLEDELILALPLVPRHPGPCPEPLPVPAADLAAADDEAPRENPFAALAGLKRRADGGGGSG